jgi:hypothetical protein
LLLLLLALLRTTTTAAALFNICSLLGIRSIRVPIIVMALRREFRKRAHLAMFFARALRWCWRMLRVRWLDSSSFWFCHG